MQPASVSKRHDQRAQHRANDGECTDDLPGFVFVAHGNVNRFGHEGQRWGRPLAAIEAAPVNCFPIALPQSDSGLQSNPQNNAHKSNGCSDMHHKIGLRRGFFDPIHRRVLQFFTLIQCFAEGHR